MPQAPLTVAVLTDVHGNGFAAEAVAEDIAHFQPDAIINLGDQLWGQANPALALEVQKSLGAYEVRGNNDERLTLSSTDERMDDPRIALQNWLRGEVPTVELERLSHLPTEMTLLDGQILAAHGTPGNPWGSLLWGWEYGPMNALTFWRRSDEEIAERLAGFAEMPVVLVGHTHREAVQHWHGRLLVNVGPVAHQNDGDPRARWTLLRREAGQWTAEMRRVAYDWQGTANWIRQGDGPNKGEADLHDQPSRDLARENHQS